MDGLVSRNISLVVTNIMTVTTFIMEEDGIYPTTVDASDGNPDTTYPWVWLPMEWTWWVILQLFFAILGILGNLLVMTVLFNRRSVRRSTDTLIGALAFADFLTSVFLIPFPQIYSLPSDTWLAQVYCRIIVTSVMMWVAVVASVFTLTAISLERFLAIAYPFYYRRVVNSTRTFRVIIVIWAAAIAVNSFQVISVFADMNRCVFRFPSLALQKLFSIFVFISEFLLPMIIMLLAQIMTAVTLNRQSLKFKETNSKCDRSNAANVNHIIARRRVLQILFLVMTVFIICWGPDQIFFMMMLLNVGPLNTSFIYGQVHHALIVLALVNSCANVFIYTIRYPEFRKAMWDMFRSGSKSMAPLFEEGSTKEQKKLRGCTSNV